MVQNCEQRRGREESDKRERGLRLMEGGERIKKPVKKRSEKERKKNKGKIKMRLACSSFSSRIR